ncbi:MAG: hypothetical protein RL748_1770 [Pseudomonadota bacterium]
MTNADDTRDTPASANTDRSPFEVSFYFDPTAPGSPERRTAYTDAGQPTALRVISLEEAQAQAEWEAQQAAKVKDQAKAATKIERMRRQLAPRKPDQDTKPRAMQAERFLTVALAPEAAPSTPWLRLRGKWLAQAGFPQSTRVRVQVELGKLIITPEEAAA